MLTVLLAPVAMFLVLRSGKLVTLDEDALTDGLRAESYIPLTLGSLMELNYH